VGWLMEFLLCLFVAAVAGCLIGALTHRSWRTGLLLIALLGPFAAYTIWMFATVEGPGFWQMWALGLMFLGLPMLVAGLATVGCYYVGRRYRLAGAGAE
jgi:hypothetical protein